MINGWYLYLIYRQKKFRNDKWEYALPYVINIVLLCT